MYSPSLRQASGSIGRRTTFAPVFAMEANNSELRRPWSESRSSSSTMTPRRVTNDHWFRTMFRSRVVSGAAYVPHALQSKASRWATGVEREMAVARYQQAADEQCQAQGEGPDDRQRELDDTWHHIPLRT